MSRQPRSPLVLPDELPGSVILRQPRALYVPELQPEPAIVVASELPVVAATMVEGYVTEWRANLGTSWRTDVTGYGMTQRTYVQAAPAVSLTLTMVCKPELFHGFHLPEGQCIRAYFEVVQDKRGN